MGPGRGKNAAASNKWPSLSIHRIGPTTRLAFFNGSANKDDQLHGHLFKNGKIESAGRLIDRPGRSWPKAHGPRPKAGPATCGMQIPALRWHTMALERLRGSSSPACDDDLSPRSVAGRAPRARKVIESNGAVIEFSPRPGPNLNLELAARTNSFGKLPPNQSFHSLPQQVAASSERSSPPAGHLLLQIWPKDLQICTTGRLASDLLDCSLEGPICIRPTADRRAGSFRSRPQPAGRPVAPLSRLRRPRATCCRRQIDRRQQVALAWHLPFAAPLGALCRRLGSDCAPIGHAMGIS